MTKLLDKLNRLCDVNETKDIKACSHAIFPGTHCPLFGATMIAAKIEGLATIVLGTEECTSYNKDFSILRNGGINNDNTYSYVMNQKEIIFGSQDEFKSAIKTVDKTNPKGILIISTCVPELIGYDIVGICLELQDEVNAKLLPVQTEHFNQTSHMSGITRTLEALSLLMEKQEKANKTINILGYRGNNLDESELFKLLRKNDVSIGLTLPTESSIDKIIKAPNAQLNLVMDFTALALAKKMKKMFNIPYIEFDRLLDINKIEKAYVEMSNILQIDLSEDICKLKSEVVQALENAKKKLTGKSFIYGNSMFNVFKYTEFLIELGMKTEFIQIRELYDGDKEIIDRLLSKGCNPYTSRIANIAPMEDIYKELQPDIFIGHENPMRLAKLNISQTAGENVKGMGFELPIQLSNSIISALDNNQENKMLKMMMGGQ